jgi:hypothetical protein
MEKEAAYAGGTQTALIDWLSFAKVDIRRTSGATEALARL